MSELTKNQLKTDNNSSFPNNTTGYITPQILRDFNVNMIDSLVDEVSYTAESASFSSSIAQLQSFSSSLDATFATDAQLTALSSSVAVTNAAQLVTASASGNTITFTKGNGSTFGVTVSGGGTIDTGSFATTGSNVFKDSQVVSGSVTATSAVLVAAGAYSNVTATADVTTDPANVFTGVGVNANDGSNRNITIALNSYAAEYPGVIVPSVIGYYTSSEGGTDIAIGFPSNGQMDVWKKSNFKYGVNVTGSLKAANGITGSLQGTASFAVTASYLIGGGGSVPSGTVSSSAQILGYGIFATTGSNNFTANQNIYADGAALTLAKNADGSGSAYTGVIVKVDNTTDPTNVYSSIGVSDDQNNGLIALAYNSYSPYYATSTAVLNGGGQYNGSDVTLGLPSNGNLDVWKPTNINAGIKVTGSFAITGSNPSIKSGSLSGSLISNLGDIYTGSNNAQYIVTLGSASMANLLAGSTTNANTLYFVLS